MRTKKMLCLIAVVIFENITHGNLGNVFSMNVVSCSGDNYKEIYENNVTSITVQDKINVSRPLISGSDEKSKIFMQTIDRVSQYVNYISCFAGVFKSEINVLILYDSDMFPMAIDDIDTMKFCIERNTGSNISKIDVKAEKQ